MKKLVLIHVLVLALPLFARAEWVSYDDFVFDVAPTYLQDGVLFRFVGANTGELMIVDLTNEMGIDGPFYYGSSSLEIPSAVMVDGETRPVTGLDKECFVYSAFDKVALPSSVRFIGNGAFNQSSIAEIVLNEGLRNIGDDSFNECRNLGYLELPNSLPVIGNGCFSYLEIKRVKFGKGLVSMGDSNFNHCQNMEEVRLPDGLNRMGGDNFNSCENLKKVIIPRYLHFDDCFNDCPQINEIVVKSRDPYGFHNSFNKVDRSVCRLIVPEESVEKYRNADGWKDFYITGDHTVGVSDLQSESSNGDYELFNLSGLKANPGAGDREILIRRTADRTEKVLITE